jgi:GTP-binding protein
VSELASMIKRAYPNLPNARWVAMRLLDGDYRVRQALESGELAQLAGELSGQPSPASA